MNVPAFDALDRTRQLQDAVLAHDRARLEVWVSDRMIWTLPSADNRRGKREWIDASCSVAWEWFDVRVLRELDLGMDRLVESWIGQRYPKNGEVIEAMGVVVDMWTIESGHWRLIARHPQRADPTDAKSAR